MADKKQGEGHTQVQFTCSRFYIREPTNSNDGYIDIQLVGSSEAEHKGRLCIGISDGKGMHKTQFIRYKDLFFLLGVLIDKEITKEFTMSPLHLVEEDKEEEIKKKEQKEGIGNSPSREKGVAPVVGSAASGGRKLPIGFKMEEVSFRSRNKATNRKNRK